MSNDAYRMDETYVKIKRRWHDLYRAIDCEGQNLDRVYVLHSPQMNEEKFPVALTRYTYKTRLYVSQSEVANMVDLKRQFFEKF